MFVYVDNAATTQVDPAVAEKVVPCFTSVFGNASSIHEAGRKAKTKGAENFPRLVIYF